MAETEMRRTGWFLGFVVLLLAGNGLQRPAACQEKKEVKPSSEEVGPLLERYPADGHSPGGMKYDPAIASMVAPNATGKQPVLWDYLAVSLGEDAKAATKELNQLVQQGWEYVGPLNANLTSFRRKMTKQQFDKKVAKEKADQKALKSLVGFWTVVSEQFDGKMVESPSLLYLHICESGQVILWHKGDHITSWGQIEFVESSDNLMRFETFLEKGTRDVRAVYTLGGGKLQICYRGFGDTRGFPESFVTAEGDGLRVYEFRRKE